MKVVLFNMQVVFCQLLTLITFVTETYYLMVNITILDYLFVVTSKTFQTKIESIV